MSPEVQLWLKEILGNRPQLKCSDLFTPRISIKMLAIRFSLETMELLEKWVATPFESDCIVFNENRIASVVALSQSCRRVVVASMLKLGVNGTLSI